MENYDHLKDRRKMSSRLRYKVLSRDRFRCVLCGRSPANDPAVSLHIDHIIPVSKGGKSNPENLQTLCMECNYGKGDD